MRMLPPAITIALQRHLIPAWPKQISKASKFIFLLPKITNTFTVETFTKVSFHQHELTVKISHAEELIYGSYENNNI